MTEIRFYHMEVSPLEKSLPAIAQKAYQSGKKVAIKARDETACRDFDDLLWAYHPNSFLPHGVESEPKADKQHVLIRQSDDNVNQADILILTGGVAADNLSNYALVCEMLDGRVSDMVAQGRDRWKSYKEAGYDLTYWQQDEGGQWHKKAEQKGETS
jgi:DNA polymerase-3 subunit chi